MKTKVYVVEDSAMARAAIMETLRNNEFEVVGSSARADLAWSQILEVDAALVILDINLVGPKNGIWLADKIKNNLDIPFIYLTAYSDASTIKEIVKTKPNGYLTKPYNEVNLLATIRMALEDFAASKNEPNHETDSAYIYLKNNYAVDKVLISDIYYLQSEGNYVKVFLEDRKILVRSKLVDLMEKLPETLFLQIHKRYLVNKSKVDQIGSDHVMILKTQISVSRAYKKNLKDIF